MTVPDVGMLAISVIGGAAALLLVTSRNVVHSALYLVVTLLAVSGTFLIVGAEFLAWAQVLVYVGAVVVLILFGLMLTRAPIGPTAQDNDNTRLALGVSMALFGFLVALIWSSFGGRTFQPTHVTTGMLGEVLYVHWALPFMALGFLLTVALIGAIIIARREEGEGPKPQPDPELESYRRRPPAATDASSTPGVQSVGEETAVARSAVEGGGS